MLTRPRGWRSTFSTSLLIVASVGLVSAGCARDGPRAVIRAAAPGYDDILVQARAQGDVVVTIRVLPSGDVAEARVTETFWPPMDELLEGYARTWRFKPGPKTTSTRVVFSYVFVPRDAPETELGWRLLAPSTVEIRHVAPRTEMSGGPGQRP